MKNKFYIFLVFFLVIFRSSNFVTASTNISYKISLKVPNNTIKATNNIQKIKQKNEKYNTHPTQKSKKAFKIKRWLKGLLIAIGAYFIGNLIAFGLNNAMGSGVGSGITNLFILLLILAVGIATIVFVVIGIKMFGSAFNVMFLSAGYNGKENTL